MPTAPDVRRHRSRPRDRRRWRLVAAVVLVAALAACSTIEAFTDLSAELRDEGFTSVETTVGGGDPVVLVVKADAPSGTSTSEGLDQATEIVWTTFPRRFDVLQLTVDGSGQRLEYAEIEDDLGPRPAHLDETDLTDEVTRLSLGVVAALVASVVLTVLVVVVVILVVTRRRRQRGVTSGPLPGGLTAWAPPAGAPGAPPAAGPPPAWGPPPAPWGPPPHWAPPPGAPLPGPGTPVADPGTPFPGPDAPVPGLRPPVPGSAFPVPVPEPKPVLTAEERREQKREARKIGRRPRGPRAPASHVPPGWDR